MRHVEGGWPKDVDFTEQVGNGREFLLEHSTSLNSHWRENQVLSYLSQQPLSKEQELVCIPSNQ